MDVEFVEIDENDIDIECVCAVKKKKKDNRQYPWFDCVKNFIEHIYGEDGVYELIHETSPLFLIHENLINGIIYYIKTLGLDHVPIMDVAFLIIDCRWNLIKIYDNVSNIETSPTMERLSDGNFIEVIERCTKCGSCLHPIYCLDKCPDDHAVCSNCWGNYFMNNINKIIPCIKNGCGIVVSYEFIDLILKGESIDYKYSLDHLKQSLYESNRHTTCPCGKGKHWFMPIPIAMNKHCIECNSSWCTLCNNAVHSPLCCDDIDRWNSRIDVNVDMTVVIEKYRLFKKVSCPLCYCKINTTVDLVNCTKCMLSFCRYCQCVVKNKSHTCLMSLSKKKFIPSINDFKFVNESDITTIDYAVGKFVVELDRMRTENIKLLSNKKSLLYNDCVSILSNIRLFLIHTIALESLYDEDVHFKLFKNNLVRIETVYRTILYNKKKRRMDENLSMLNEKRWIICKLMNNMISSMHHTSNIAVITDTDLTTYVDIPVKYKKLMVRWDHSVSKRIEDISIQTDIIKPNTTSITSNPFIRNFIPKIKKIKQLLGKDIVWKKYQKESMNQMHLFHNVPLGVLEKLEIEYQDV